VAGKYDSKPGYGLTLPGDYFAGFEKLESALSGQPFQLFAWDFSQRYESRQALDEIDVCHVHLTPGPTLYFVERV
jgi:hypothetical protein